MDNLIIDSLLHIGWKASALFLPFWQWMSTRSLSLFIWIDSTVKVIVFFSHPEFEASIPHTIITIIFLLSLLVTLNHLLRLRFILLWLNEIVIIHVCVWVLKLGKLLIVISGHHDLWFFLLLLLIELLQLLVLVALNRDWDNTTVIFKQLRITPWIRKVLALESCRLFHLLT